MTITKQETLLPYLIAALTLAPDNGPLRAKVESLRATLNGNAAASSVGVASIGAGAGAALFAKPQATAKRANGFAAGALTARGNQENARPIVAHSQTLGKRKSASPGKYMHTKSSNQLK
jgi:hypothetical protein